MRENLARAVLRDLRQQGHEHVELRWDGVTAVLHCSLCDTRCYNESALWDHLNGKGHLRHYESVRAKEDVWGKQAKREFADVDGDNNSWATTEVEERWEASYKGSTLPGDESCPSGEFEGHSVSATSSTMSLKWIGSGELLLKTKATRNPYAEASWFFWQGMYQPTVKNWHESGDPCGIEYAVVIFPYSNGIGRGGNWPSLCRPGTKGSRVLESINLRRGHKISRQVRGIYRLKTQVSREIVASTGPSPPTTRHKPLSPLTLTIRTNPTRLVSPEVLESIGDPAKIGVENVELITTHRKIWKQKQVKNPDRICFICRQKLLPTQDVAALVNVKSGQMICGSRNRRGVFHVFHSACLIEWIAFCEAKTWNASLTMSRKLKRRKTIHPSACQQDRTNDGHEGSGNETEFTSETAIFCPECQGTGVKLHGPELERPRFRLNQVYEWVMELIEARKAYLEDHGNPLGLLFVKSANSKSPGAVQSRGFIHCYSARGYPDSMVNAMSREVE